VKARKVNGLDPAAPLAENAERIVRTRLDELCSFMPAAADPAAVIALHDMRIAAKRLRYVLEVTGHGFGPYATTAIKHVKELQELLGEVHDCDVQAPDAAALLEELAGADVAELAAGRAAPNRAAYAGLVAVGVHLRARRETLRLRFLERWEELERKGFRARLEYALTERRGADGAIIEDPE
jgi:CHAD domain-containing protein